MHSCVQFLIQALDLGAYLEPEKTKERKIMNRTCLFSLLLVGLLSAAITGCSSDDDGKAAAPAPSQQRWTPPVGQRF